MSPMIIIRILPILAGVIMYYKYKFKPITFYVMYMISVCGLGFYFNDMFRLGPIFPSDLYMLLFVAVCIFSEKGKIKVQKREFRLIVIVTFLEIALGLVGQYALEDILSDFKLILYFFIPYFYGKIIKDKKEESKICLYTYCFCVGISLLLNWIHFFQYGLINIASGGDQIVRTFGIGLGFSCGSLITCMLMDFKIEFVKKYGYVLYYIIHILLILSALISFTRTSWIVYGITVLVNWILVCNKQFKTPDEILKRVFNVVIVGVITYWIIAFFSKTFPDITDAIISRMMTIRETTTDQGNTFVARINDVLAGADVFASPRILWGYGLGALYKNAKGYFYAQGENSFIYYLWKYGIILGGYLFYRVGLSIRKRWKSGVKVERTVAIYLVVSLIISSLSGNMNRPYSLGALAIVMSINYTLCLKKQKI